MKRTFTLLLGMIMLWTSSTVAQDRYYTFKDSTATYQELMGATVLTTTFDQEAYTMTLDFNIKAFDVEFEPENIDITWGGFIVGKNLTLDRMFALDGFAVWQFQPIDANSSLSYLVEGNPGSRIVKVQFKNVTPKYGNPASDVVNFQMWLYEDGSAMEIHIGPVNVATSSGLYFDPSATGPQCGIFLSNTSFSQKYELQFLRNAPANPTLEFNNNFVFLNAPPAYGTVYKFRHIVVPPPPKSIMLGSPVGGEIWKVGEKHDIIWGAESIDKVKIELSTNNGSTWMPVTTIDAAPEKYSWTIPSSISTSCKIRISDNDDPDIKSESMFAFEIRKASSSGIAELINELRVNIYPIPATDKLTVSMPSDISINGINIRILGIDGKEVLTRYNASGIDNNYELNLSGISTGTYLIEVSAGKRVSRQYFVKN